MSCGWLRGLGFPVDGLMIVMYVNQESIGTLAAVYVLCWVVGVFSLNIHVRYDASTPYDEKMVCDLV